MGKDALRTDFVLTWECSAPLTLVNCPKPAAPRSKEAYRWSGKSAITAVRSGLLLDTPNLIRTPRCTPRRRPIARRIENQSVSKSSAICRSKGRQMACKAMPRSSPNLGRGRRLTATMARCLTPAARYERWNNSISRHGPRRHFTYTNIILNCVLRFVKF
jgi:hypothetical protein